MKFKRSPITNLVCALSTILVFSSSSATAGGILFVDDDAAPGGNGASWDIAYRFLRDALTVAAGGEISEIRVAQGTYKPDRDEANPKGTGDIYLAFNLPGGVSLLGGYAGIGKDDPNARDFDAFETILTGDLLGNDVLEQDMTGPTLSDNSKNVIVVAQESDPVVIEGFTIVGGKATGSANHGGGGIDNFLGDSTISHCRFIRNYSASGGAINSLLGSASISDCVFIENYGYHGGGIYAKFAVLNCVRCDFVENRSTWGGGVKAEAKSTVCITDCSFSGNLGGGYGGGMYLHDSFVTVSQCLFENNIANTVEGGGIRHRGGSLELYDCDFIGNYARISGSGLWHESTAGSIGVPIIKRCNFIGNIGETFSSGVGARISGSAVIESCVFSDHHDGRDGVGLFISGNNIQISNCIFSNNSGSGNGAGAKIGASTAAITNCLFTGNIANEEGGGLHLNNPGVTISNSTFTNNHSDLAGGGIYVGSPQGGGVILNSIVYGNSGSQIDAAILAPTVSFSCVQDGWPGDGSNNIDADPMFIDPGSGDYRLSSGSPCIDAGNNWGVPVDANDYDEDDILCELFPVDLDGNPRFNADEADFDPGCGIPVVVDMGAYEYQFDPVDQITFADLTGDGAVNTLDLLALFAEWGECAAKGCCLADLDIDGNVNTIDLLILFANWGACG